MRSNLSEKGGGCGNVCVLCMREKGGVCICVCACVFVREREVYVFVKRVCIYSVDADI